MKAFLTSHNLKEEHFEAFKKLIGSEKVNNALLITLVLNPSSPSNDASTIPLNHLSQLRV